MKIFLWLALASFGAPRIEIMPVSELLKIKKQSCTFIHLWAMWCPPCVKELPAVFKVLVSLGKEVRAIVIDVSGPETQEKESKKLVQKLAPPFVTYIRPAVSDDVYMEAIERSWMGGLPYSALYDGGLKKKEWVGSLDLKSVVSSVRLLCKKR